MTSSVQTQRQRRVPLWRSRDQLRFGAVLLALMIISTAIHTIGLRQELPYAPQVDEPSFVIPALKIVATGSLNPGWFGHPGSTVIYPVALGIHLLNVTNGGPLLHGDPAFWPRMLANPSPYFMLGRWLMLLYWIGCVPLIALLGQRVAGRAVGLLAALLVTLSPLMLSYAQIIRTDIAGTFFALLTLLALLRLERRRSDWDLALVGIALGLSIATRYFLVMLFPPAALFCLLLIRAAGQPWRAALRMVLLIGAVAGAVFLISSPYVVLDYRATLRSLRAEAQQLTPGADGFSPLGNLWWYLTNAIPSDLGWLFLLLALVGGLLAVRRHHPADLLLLSYVGCCLVGVSLSQMHWDRYLIPVIPVLAVMAGAAAASAWRRFPAPAARVAVLLLLAAIIAPAANTLYVLKRQQSGATTRVLAREWVTRMLPVGSRVAQEKYAATLNPADFFGLVSRGGDRPEQPLTEQDLLVSERFSLAMDRTLADYQRAGVRYLIVSSAIYDRFLDEPGRYPAEVRFYRTLFQLAPLKRFDPSATVTGPSIQVYDLALLGQP